MMLDQIMDDALRPAMALLPARMNTPAADCMLLAIGLQESRFVHRRQIGGPARGFWQFEKGTRASRGGVWGVFLHAASRDHLATLCKAGRRRRAAAALDRSEGAAAGRRHAGGLGAVSAHLAAGQAQAGQLGRPLPAGRDGHPDADRQEHGACCNSGLSGASA